MEDAWSGCVVCLVGSLLFQSVCGLRVCCVGFECALCVLATFCVVLRVCSECALCVPGVCSVCALCVCFECVL